VISTINTTILMSPPERNDVIPALASDNVTTTTEPAHTPLKSSTTTGASNTTTTPTLAVGVNDTNTTNTTSGSAPVASTIAPTTLLPSLKSLLATGVQSTLISNLKQTLIEYQHQNPAADLSALTTNLEEVVQYYEVVSMVIGISAFARTIKDSHPEVAQIYDTKLKKITDEIRQAIDNDKSHARRLRRAPIRHLTTTLLNELYTFTKAPMNEEMRAFFKGFEAEREQFAQIMSTPDTDMPQPLRHMFQQMRSVGGILVAMDEYGDQTKDLLSSGQYEEVGRIALRINILCEVGTQMNNAAELGPGERLNDPYGDLLAEFQRFEQRHLSALSRITDSTSAFIPLHEIITYSYIYDPLRTVRLGDGLDEGFCFADTLTLAAAAEYKKIADSLGMMAQSILHGSGYAKYPLRLRQILQELSFLGGRNSLENDILAFGVKESVYYNKIVDEITQIREALLRTIKGSRFKSTDKLIARFLKLFNPLTSHIQLMFQPSDEHVVYMEIRKLDDLYKLTVHDINSGLHIVTGRTPDELKAAAFDQLREFHHLYGLPEGSAGGYVPGVGYARMTPSLLAPLEDMQLFPDSALTVKDILTNPSSQLQAIDIANTQALIEQYLNEVSKKTNQKLLKQDKKASEPVESPAESITIKDPIIAQMREVLAVLKESETEQTSTKTKPEIPQQVKELNTHILRVIDLFAKQTANPEQQTSSAASSDLPVRDWATMGADELIKLGIERDFIRLVNPAAVGLKVVHPASPDAQVDPAQASEGAHASSVGGNIAGGFASFVAAVGGALASFRITCPGCLTDLLSRMLANLQRSDSEELLLEEMAKRSGQQALKEAAKEGAEEAAKEAAEKAAKEAAKEAAEKAAKEAAEEAAKDAAEKSVRKLVRCRRSGVCDVSRVVKDLLESAEEAAEIAEMMSALDAASDAADAAAIKIATDKIADWLKNIFSGHKKKDKDHKHEEISVEQFVEAVRRLRTTPKPATHKTNPPPTHNRKADTTEASNPRTAQVDATEHHTTDTAAATAPFTAQSTAPETTAPPAVETDADTSTTTPATITTKADATTTSTPAREHFRKLTTNDVLNNSTTPPTQSPTTPGITVKTDITTISTPTNEASQPTAEAEPTSGNSTTPVTQQSTKLATTTSTATTQQSTTPATTGTAADEVSEPTTDAISGNSTTPAAQQSTKLATTTSPPTHEVSQPTTGATSGNSTATAIQQSTKLASTTSTITDEISQPATDAILSNSTAAVTQQSTKPTTASAPTNEVSQPTTDATSGNSTATATQQSKTLVTTGTATDEVSQPTTDAISGNSTTPVAQQSTKLATTTSAPTDETSQPATGAISGNSTTPATQQSTTAVATGTVTDKVSQPTTAAISGNNTTPVTQQSTKPATTTSAPTNEVSQPTTETTSGNSTVAAATQQSTTPVTSTPTDEASQPTTEATSDNSTTPAIQQSTEQATSAGPSVVNASQPTTTDVGSASRSTTPATPAITSSEANTTTITEGITQLPATDTVSDNGTTPAVQPATTAIATNTSVTTERTMPLPTMGIRSDNGTTLATQLTTEGTSIGTTTEPLTSSANNGTTSTRPESGTETASVITPTDRHTTAYPPAARTTDNSQMTTRASIATSSQTNPSTTATEPEVIADPTSSQNTTASTQRSTTETPQAALMTFLTTQASQIKERFNQHIASIVKQSLNDIGQLTDIDAKRESVQKRIILGDALNAFKQEINEAFFGIWHDALATLNEAPKATPAVTSVMMAAFEDLYKALATQRLQLFIAAGYLNESELSRDELSQLRPGVDKNDRDTSYLDNLFKVLNQRSHVAVSGKLNDYLHDLTDFLRAKQTTATSSADQSPSTAATKATTGGTPMNDEQLLLSLFNLEKELFIDDVQKLHLQNTGHFDDEVLLDEAGEDTLFLPYTFLDVIKDPDAYRDTGAVRKPRQRRGIDRPLSATASSATRPHGVLGDIKESISGLLSPAIGSDSQPDPATKQVTPSARFNGMGNLALAALISSHLNDRQLETQRLMESRSQDRLNQAPGLGLLADSLAISAQLKTEVSAFIHQLEASDRPVSANWNLDDLVNMAILQATPGTQDRVTETFLHEVLKSTRTGINHERLGNIFAADGRVRGTTGQEIFHNPATGKTTTTGPASGLAQSMLQAMAIGRLASYSEHSLPDDLRRQIIRKVGELNNRRETTPDVFGLTTESGRLKTSVAQIADMIDDRLASEVAIVPENRQHDPVISVLSRGQFIQGKQLFMQLSPQHQLESVEALAKEPDYLGVDDSAESLAKLRARVQTHGDNAKSDWQESALGEQAWELFSNLYDNKIAAPKEATARMKVQAAVSHRGITDTTEAAQLGKLLIQLLPRRAGASDFVLTTPETADRPPLQLHRFEPKRIAGMISDYKELKAFLDQRCFARVFGDAVTDPQLRNELVSHVARITLDALKGNIAAGNWRQIASRNLTDEYAEFTGKSNEIEQTDTQYPTDKHAGFAGAPDKSKGDS